MLRSLERSNEEQLRLVSARHHGALGRLTERRRDKNRRRKHELRERLAATKSGVVSAWREHNRCLFLGAGSASKKRRAARENGDPLEKSAAAAAIAEPPPPSPPVVEAAAVPAAMAAAVASRAAATGSGGYEAEPQCQMGEVKLLLEGSSAADVNVVANGGTICTKQTDTSPRTSPGHRCDSAPRVREPAAPEAGGIKARAFFCRDTTADTSTQQKQQPPPRAAAVSPAAATTTFFRGRGRGRGRGTTRVPARKPQKQRATSTSTKTPDGSLELPTTDAPVALTATAFVNEAVGVLSEEEVQALAALGRGTPNDPRLLLVACRPPSEARVEVTCPTRNALTSVTRDTREDDDYCAKKSYHDSDGGRAIETVVRGSGNTVLERAVDKLVPEMRAREELTRRSFGMASLAS